MQKKTKVKVFDASHEKDLEVSVNEFLETLIEEPIDIQYQVSIAVNKDEQVYCFSVMILYYK